MIYEKNLTGRYVELRSADLDDAEFTLNIRRDPEFKNFFPNFTGTPETQKAWLKYQREKPGDYFFVIWDLKTNTRAGTISVYDIQGDECEGGRVAVRSKNPFHAVEAQLLADEFAFKILGLKKVHAHVFADNKRALNFSKLFENTFEPAEYDQDLKREIIHAYRTPQDFERAYKKISAMLYR